MGNSRSDDGETWGSSNVLTSEQTNNGKLYAADFVTLATPAKRLVQIWIEAANATGGNVTIEQARVWIELDGKPY